MKKKFISKIIIFLLCFSNFSNVVTSNALEDTNINFKNLSIEDGLSQATVETIIQDSNGYIWFGTNDGLNRYNGYNFKLYRNDKSIENSLVNNYIVDLKEDNESNIWVGTASGISKINSKGEIVRNYTVGKENGNLSHNNIGDILVRKNGQVVVATSDGLNIYNKEIDKFERIFKDKALLKDQYIYTLDEDEEGNIWVGTKGGLFKVSIEDNEVESYLTDQKVENRIYKVYCDINNIVWAGTINSGLIRIDTTTGETKTYSYSSDKEYSLPGNFVRNLYRDTRGKLWVCTNQGLAYLNESNSNFITFKNKIYDNRSLVNDDTFVITEDKSGLLFVGTYSGFSIFDPDNKVKHLKKDPFNENSLNDNMIQGIYEDDNGLVWIGTNSKGLNILNRRTNEFTHINSIDRPGFLSDDSINDITGVGNTVYIGTDNGLNIINTKDNSIKIINEIDGLNDEKVKSIFLDSKGNLWIGTVQGYNVLRLSDSKIYDLNPIFDKYNITDNYPGAIYEDSDGIYWLGGFIDGGLIKLDPKSETVTNYKYDNKNINSISDNSIKTINEDSKGNLWIGTSAGINKFSKETETFTRYSIKDGLANDNIYGILFDEFDNLWCSTNMGVSKLDAETNMFTNLNITHGLQSNEFNGESYFKNKNGEFYFGGINGLNIFNPMDIMNEDYSPSVVFDEFKVNGIIQNEIANKEFKYNENTINIQVFLPEYNSSNIQYYYSLSERNEDWILMENNEVTLSNLSTGNYTFKVKARKSNGMFSDVNTLKFTIEPPFWRNEKSIFIYIIIGILVILQYRNRVKKLDAMVAFRTKKLHEEGVKNEKLFNKLIDLERRKNNYFVNLSHELRTPLNVLSSTEQLITELNRNENGIDRDKLGYYMGISNKNIKRLLKIINDLIDTSKVENGSYKLNIKTNNIVYIVEEATLSMKEYVESKGINLIIDPEIEEKFIKCDALEIERCIINIVGNATKFTSENGSITVRIVDLDDKVKIEIIDTGIGIDSKYHKVIFDRFNQVIDSKSEEKGGSGLGLTITKNIIDLHNGDIFVESELKKGSKFTIILPCNIK